MPKSHRTLNYLPAGRRRAGILPPRLNFWLGMLLVIVLFGAALLYAAGVLQGGL